MYIQSKLEKLSFPMDVTKFEGDYADTFHAAFVDTLEGPRDFVLYR
jgi:hypothetical protein